MEMKKIRNLSKVIQDVVLRNMFGSTREDVTGDWKKWHTEVIRDP